MDAEFDQNVRQLNSAPRTLAASAPAARVDLDHFIYTVSHDLKSPLVTLQGFASLLERDVLAGRTDRLAEFAQQIKDGVALMARLIDDLLVLSRVGRITRPPEIVDLADLSRKIVRLHQLEIDRGGIDVEVQDDIPLIQVDKERIADVLERLVANAIRFGCTHAAPLIRIGGRATSAEVRYFVSDNGPGIPAQHHEKIFNLFERLDPTSAGTGAGLAIVRRSLEVLGGRAWVESTPGQGATFWLAFPGDLRVDRSEPSREEPSR